MSVKSSKGSRVINSYKLRVGSRGKVGFWSPLSTCFYHCLSVNNKSYKHAHIHSLHRGLRVVNPNPPINPWVNRVHQTVENRVKTKSSLSVDDPITMSDFRLYHWGRSRPLWRRARRAFALCTLIWLLPEVLLGSLVLSRLHVENEHSPWLRDFTSRDNRAHNPNAGKLS